MSVVAEAPPTVPVTSACEHCGLALENTEERYCCRGCQAAARLICEAGLERYYLEREAFAPRPGAVDYTRWDDDTARRCADGSLEARLAIDDLRCSSCVWVTERVLEQTPGVTAATVSYATGRATIRWDPDQTDLADVASRVSSLGYRPRPLAEDATPDRGLLSRAGVATFLAANVMLLSVALYAGWFDGMARQYEALFQWTSLVLATPAALWCAEPFFRGAWRGLRGGVLHMDLPISIAIGVLYGHALVVTPGGGEAYLDSLTMLIALLLFGRVLESRGRRRAAEAAMALASHLPPTARRVSDGVDEGVATEDLIPGDRVRLGAGEEVPADGVVDEGNGWIQSALLTGESAPEAVGAGDSVAAGTWVSDGGLIMRVVRAGEDTMLHRMTEELRAAGDRGLRHDAADGLAPWFTGGTLVAAATTFAAWSLLGDGGEALRATVAVLVVACPCALALSRPLAAAAGLGAAARRGALFRSGDALLDLADVDLAALDKTGTLTAGALTVTDAPDEALRVAAALERYSIHPVARAIVEEAHARDIPLAPATNIREIPGVGVDGDVDECRWSLRASGPGQVSLRSDDRGWTLTLGDRPRDDAIAATRRLVETGVPVALLSGDREEPTAALASDLGVADYAGRMDPTRKAGWVRDNQSEGRTVLFVGDGLNDGPALAAADVGIAMGTGAPSSLLTADGILVSGRLSALHASILVARLAKRAVRMARARSVVYNLTAVAAAALGFVNPLVAAVLMPLSSGMVMWTASGIERRMRRT
jgi:Cu2+-exporting ATPase